MEHIATTLNKDPTAIRRLNMYKQGQVTFPSPDGGTWSPDYTWKIAKLNTSLGILIWTHLEKSQSY